MISWKDLAPGPALRRIIAERRGWHIRKILVGSGDIAYDYFVYNEDDMLVYQREITNDDLADEAGAEQVTWLQAMDDEDCPRWDEDLDEAEYLVYGLDYDIRAHEGHFHAWVTAPEHSGTGASEALALVRAWLAATEGQDDFRRPT